VAAAGTEGVHRHRFGTLAFDAEAFDPVPGRIVSNRVWKCKPMSSVERIIRLKTVLARTGLSRTTLYRKMGEGTFPRQVRISVHGAGWHESAVNSWIANPTIWREESAGRGM
jgi:prophage regulatory protein